MSRDIGSLVEPINASMTELRSLLKQAFEGCGFSHGAYESATEIVLWSQASGFGGFAALENSLSRCEKSPTTNLLINAEQAKSCTVSAVGDSALVCGTALCDFVSAKAQESDYCECHVSHIDQPLLLAKLIADAQRFGLSAGVYWQQDQHWCLLKTVELLGVEYIHVPNDQGQALADNWHKGDLIMFVGFSESEIELRIEQRLGATNESHIQLSVEQQVLLRQAALNDGLQVPRSLWDELNRVAANVLVESTEQSRKGAGA